MINYTKVIFNLRGAGCLSCRQIAELTGVSQAKQYRMMKGYDFEATDKDMINLADIHLDYCPHLHNKSILDKGYLRSISLRDEANGMRDD